MDASLTIQDLFKLILYLLGIGALVYLILFIKNLNSAMSNIKNIINQNNKEIDTTLKQLPHISQNINDISEGVKELIKEASPDAIDLVSNVNSITEKLDNTSTKVTEAIDEVSESITSTASTIENNVKNVSYYIELIMDIIDILKGAFKKKR